MEQKGHQKHAKLNRPDYGQFHSQEWAILGTSCGKIQQLCKALADRLVADYRLAYVDADHAEGDQMAAGGMESPLAAGFSRVYTDKIHYHEYAFNGHLDVYQQRIQMKDEDVVLVNGNHFQAKRQIVVIDPKKEKSLHKRLSQLTDVAAILYTEGQSAVYPFLREALPSIDTIPSFAFNDVQGIAAFLLDRLQAAKPPLYGLVLAGGKSQRMGEDKGLISYHGKPQRAYMAEVLAPLCEEVFLSCRPDQAQDIAKNHQALPDSFSGLGPFGGILSAFRAHPDAAWLVVACDLPLLDSATLQTLIEARNPSKLATAFNSPVNEFPEPLICIWEPRSYLSLLQFLAQGYSCPRKVLINSDVELIDVKNPNTLLNINRPEERDEILSLNTSLK